MFNRIAFAGSFYPNYWHNYLPDLNLREFYILLILVVFTVVLGIYPSIILDTLHFSVSTLIFTVDHTNINDLNL
jgi:NADH-ubiquinone oxidoreductase chain 4